MKRIAILLTGLMASAAAHAAEPVKIGVMNDQSGVFADFQGIGSVIAAQMAVEDFGPTVAGHPIEVVSADHQNKVDTGLTIARHWLDQDGVDVIADVPNSAIALGVASLAREKNKVFLGSGAGTSELTGKQCSPNTVHWTYDTWELGHGFARALTEEGGKTWFFVAADYSFGKDLTDSASAEVKALGGTVLGVAQHPLNNTDFASPLLQAQASQAQVVAFADSGDDMTNALKQAAEFGMAKKQRFAPFVFNITNVPGLGLQAAQGVYVLTPFYWDMTDGTRAFAKRFMERHPRHLAPNDMQAGVYSSVLAYLHAVQQVGDATDGRAVVAAMKRLGGDDPLFGKTTIRPDGRAMHPVYLMTVKSPAESKGPWDDFKLVRTIPADDAFRPLNEGGCPLLTQ